MFMNRVHEQCQKKIDSGKIPSRTGQKTGRVHQVHSPGQPVHPSRAPTVPCRAPAAPCRARPAPCHTRACRPVACVPARPAVQLPAGARCAPRPRAHAGACALRARPARSAPAQRPSVPSCPVLGHNTPRCIATQFLLAHCPSQVTIQNCIVTQFISQLTSFAAIQFYVLQYNFSNPLPAIQYLYCNQPFQTCCNTIFSLAIYLGSSPKFNFLHKIFFILINFFFSFISRNWKNH